MSPIGVLDVVAFALGVIMLYVAMMRFGLIAMLVLMIVLTKLGVLRLPVVLFTWLLGRSSLNPREALLQAALRRSDVMMQPVTTKTSQDDHNQRLSYGFSCMQGWRRTMEDAHTAVLDSSTVQPPGGLDPGSSEHAVFAVFDGHCGSSIATFCGSMLPQFLVASNAYRNGRFKDAFVETYLAMDKHLKAHPSYGVDRSGCTAVSVLITESEIYCANAGDSRCVLCRDGRAQPLSHDHKPYQPSELRRIQRAGGFVVNRRVQGILALSRAIGDFSFKARVGIPWEEQAVTCVPDVQTHRIDTNHDEFLVIACDGIWDVMSNQDVVSFVRPRIARNVPLSAICEQLMDQCLSREPMGLGCDNMSVFIVQFRGQAAR